MESNNPRRPALMALLFSGALWLVIAALQTLAYAFVGANRAYELGVFAEAPWWYIPPRRRRSG